MFGCDLLQMRPNCMVTFGATCCYWGATLTNRSLICFMLLAACLIIFDLANWCWMILAMFPRLNVSLFSCQCLFLQADVSSLRTSQRCLQSELLKLRAQNAKEIWVSSYVKAAAGSSLELLFVSICFALWCSGRKFHSHGKFMEILYVTGVVWLAPC